MPGAVLAQTTCPVPGDMVTGVRVHYSATVYEQFAQDPDNATAILSEGYVDGQLYLRKVLAAGIYLESASVDQTRSGEVVPLVENTYETTPTVPLPDSQWTLHVTVSSQTGPVTYEDQWSYWTGPVETIQFGDCPVRVFYFDFKEAIAPNDPSRFMYLPDFGFMIDARPESQDPNSQDYQPFWMEPL